jgi:preprotein translocase subunit YajC
MNFFLLAQDTETSDPGGSMLFTLLFMGAIFGAMYFLMIRPQRKRLRETQQMQRAMGEGDEVVTTAGVYGFVTALDGDVVWLEIAENVEIRVARAAIARVVTPISAVTDTTDDSDVIADADDDTK